MIAPVRTPSRAPSLSIGIRDPPPLPATVVDRRGGGGKLESGILLGIGNYWCCAGAVLVVVGRSYKK